jgi:antitoxin HigA-1
MKLRSSTTTRRQRPARPDRLPPVHPGEVLLQEFLKPMNISQYRLAKDISVPPRRVNEIVLNKRGITADTALRLGRYFGTSEQFWLNLQSEYDLDVERDHLGDRLRAEVVEQRWGTVGVAASPDVHRTRKSTGSSSRWQVASSKRTGSKAATAASRILRSGATSKKSKSAAGSALAQRKSTKVTSRKAATAASATLRSRSTGKASKSAAASALAQRQRRRK